MPISTINTNSIADDAVTVPKVTDQVLTHRNLIINGAMQVAQRGTSVTGKTDLAYHTVDRWQSVGSGSTYSQSQQAVTLGDSTVGDFKYFLRHEVTTANDFAGILYKIEDVQSVPEGIVTLSFYAKGTNPGGGSLQLRGRQNFGSGGSPSSEVIQTAQTLTLTSSWQRFTYQITVPSISGKTLGTAANTSYYRIDIQQPSDDDTTDAWTLDITGVQLEVGDTATPFEHRSFGEELSLCQRYYQKSYPSTKYAGENVGGGAYAFIPINAIDDVNILFKQTMTKIPTITVYRKNGTATSSAQRADNAASYMAVTVSDISDNGFHLLPATSVSRRYRIHYIADAEL